MQKTINIALQGMQFTLEEPAFDRLHAYLESLKTHFANYDEKADIIADIEGRIAEHLSERLVRGSVGTLEDIDALIVEMGSAEDLSAFDGTEAKSSASTSDATATTKRLYRDVDNAMIAGVCSGIAAYFDVDPTLVRILFAVSIFVTGVGLPVYLVMWFIVPPARSQTDKLRMRGLPVTVSTFEQQRTKPEEDSSPAKRPGRLLLWIILIIAGSVFGAMLIGMLAASFFTISHTETSIDESQTPIVMPIYNN